METNSMVPTVKWIRKGFATENPKFAKDIYENSDVEKEMEIEDAAEKSFEKYDEEESKLMRDLPTFVSESNPKNTKFKDEYPAFADDSGDDEEDYRIKSTDCILLAAKIEEESSSFEVYIYEEEKFNLYVHHEVMLNAFPVALEWLCCDFSKAEEDSFLKGNFAIVGLMNSGIEIWNLDILESVEPYFTVDPKEAHKDSITNLAMHSSRANVLASSGADKTVKFWDLQQVKLVATFSKLNEVPQNIIWDLNNEALIHTYSSDNVIRTIDARGPKESSKLKVNFSIENFAISPVNPELMFISCEDGFIRTVDMKMNKIRNDLAVQAHTEAVTSIVCNKAGQIVSNSLDGNASVFDVRNLNKLATQETDCKRLFGSSIHPDSDKLFACGSEIGEVVIWDFTNDIGKNK